MDHLTRLTQSGLWASRVDRTDVRCRGEDCSVIATQAVHVLITHVGGPTALIEVGGWRLLTDPTFDAPGGKYKFGYGTGSR